MRGAVALLTTLACLAFACGSGEAQSHRDPFSEIPNALPGLPRVLLIGDSISLGYTLALRDALEGEVVLHRIPRNGGPTQRGLAELDAWLERGPWDLIYFNFGLWDILRTPPQAPTATSPEEYEQNLRQIVARLERERARLVWASTTPVPSGVPAMRNDDVIRYNEVARRVMQERGVTIDDLHAAFSDKLETLTQGSSDVHLSEAGAQMLSEHIAATIRHALDSWRDDE